MLSLSSQPTLDTHTLCIHSLTSFCSSLVSCNPSRSSHKRQRRDLAAVGNSDTGSLAKSRSVSQLRATPPTRVVAHSLCSPACSLSYLFPSLVVDRRPAAIDSAHPAPNLSPPPPLLHPTPALASLSRQRATQAPCLRLQAQVGQTNERSAWDSDERERRGKWSSPTRRQKGATTALQRRPAPPLNAAATIRCTCFCRSCR